MTLHSNSIVNQTTTPPSSSSSRPRPLPPPLPPLLSSSPSSTTAADGTVNGSTRSSLVDKFHSFGENLFSRRNIPSVHYNNIQQQQQQSQQRQQQYQSLSSLQSVVDQPVSVDSLHQQRPLSAFSGIEREQQLHSHPQQQQQQQQQSQVVTPQLSVMGVRTEVPQHHDQPGAAFGQNVQITNHQQRQHQQEQHQQLNGHHHHHHHLQFQEQQQQQQHVVQQKEQAPGLAFLAETAESQHGQLNRTTTIQASGGGGGGGGAYRSLQLHQAQVHSQGSRAPGDGAVWRDYNDSGQPPPANMHMMAQHHHHHHAHPHQSSHVAQNHHHFDHQQKQEQQGHANVLVNQVQSGRSSVPHLIQQQQQHEHITNPAYSIPDTSTISIAGDSGSISGHPHPHPQGFGSAVNPSQIVVGPDGQHYIIEDPNRPPVPVRVVSHHQGADGLQYMEFEPIHMPGEEYPQHHVQQHMQQQQQQQQQQEHIPIQPQPHDGQHPIPVYGSVPLEAHGMPLHGGYPPEMMPPASYPMVSDHFFPPPHFVVPPGAVPPIAVAAPMYANWPPQEQEQRQQQQQQQKQKQQSEDTTPKTRDHKLTNGAVGGKRVKRQRAESDSSSSGRYIHRSVLARKLLKRASQTRSSLRSMEQEESDADDRRSQQQQQQQQQQQKAMRKSLRIQEKRKERRKRHHTARKRRNAVPPLSGRISLREAALEENYYAKWDSDGVYFSPSESDDEICDAIIKRIQSGSIDQQAHSCVESFPLLANSLDMLADTADLIVACVDRLNQEMTKTAAATTTTPIVAKNKRHCLSNLQSTSSKANSSKMESQADANSVSTQGENPGLEKEMSSSDVARMRLLYDPIVQRGLYNFVITGERSKQARARDILCQVNSIGCARSPYIIRNPRVRKLRPSLCKNLSREERKADRRVRKGIGFDPHEIMSLSDIYKVSIEEIEWDFSAAFENYVPPVLSHSKSVGNGDLTIQGKESEGSSASAKDEKSKEHASPDSASEVKARLGTSWQNLCDMGIYSTEDGASKLLEQRMGFKSKVFGFNRNLFLDLTSLDRKQIQRDIKDIRTGQISKHPDGKWTPRTQRRRASSTIGKATRTTRARSSMSSSSTSNTASVTSPNEEVKTIDSKKGTQEQHPMEDESQESSSTSPLTSASTFPKTKRASVSPDDESSMSEDQSDSVTTVNVRSRTRSGRRRRSSSVVLQRNDGSVSGRRSRGRQSAEHPPPQHFPANARVTRSRARLSREIEIAAKGEEEAEAGEVAIHTDDDTSYQGGESGGEGEGEGADQNGGDMKKEGKESGADMEEDGIESTPASPAAEEDHDPSNDDDDDDDDGGDDGEEEDSVVEEEDDDEHEEDDGDDDDLEDEGYSEISSSDTDGEIVASRVRTRSASRKRRRTSLRNPELLQHVTQTRYNTRRSERKLIEHIEAIQAKDNSAPSPKSDGSTSTPGPRTRRRSIRR